jgi:hypothetical protein
MVGGGPFKGLGAKSQMMSGITYFGGFGYIDFLMVVHLMVVHLIIVYSIVHSMKSFKFWMRTNQNSFKAQIVKNN